MQDMDMFDPGSGYGKNLLFVFAANPSQFSVISYIYAIILKAIAKRTAVHKNYDES